MSPKPLQPFTVTLPAPVVQKTTLSVGLPGPRGPRGYTGASGVSGADHLSKLSLGPLSAGRIVRLVDDQHVCPVSSLVPADALCPVGIVQNAVSAAELDVGVVVYGEQEDDTWQFTPGGVLFLGPAGFLVQQRDPSWAYARVIGFAVSATRVFIDPQLPIFQL